MGELETAAEKTRTESASYLREVAEQLDGTGDVALELGGKQVLVNPTDPITFKLEGESDWWRGTRKQDKASNSSWSGGVPLGHVRKERSISPTEASSLYPVCLRTP